MIVSIKSLLDGYQEKKFSPTEITQWYLERIKKLDAELHSYITVTEEAALKQAKIAEDKMNAGFTGSLLGVPISMKDSIDTKGILTTNGSIIDKERVPDENAAIVSLLEEEGTILLGKNNMYEYGGATISENPYFGDIMNQWNKNKTAGGSSGGSAAAVAANLCLASIGTDASGSIRVPAACCGVIGIKPTHHHLNMNGIDAFSWTLTDAGILTSNIEDSTIVLATMTGVPYEAVCLPDLKGVRVGLPKSYFNEDMAEEIAKMYQKVIQQLVELGATLVEVDTSFLTDTVMTSRTIGTSELGVVFQEQIASISHLFSEGMQETFKRSRQITAFDYLNALKKREEWLHAFSTIFSEVDVILTPAMPIATPDVGVRNGLLEGESLDDTMVRYTNVFNVTGHPALALPVDQMVQGAPLGIQLIADYHREDNLYRVGYAYEQFALLDLYADRQSRF